MKFLKILFIFFAFAISSFVQAKSLFTVDLSRVESRALLGGLNSSGPIGNTTEFFVDELDTPLLSIPGEHESFFKNKIYIYKNKNYYVCPKDQFDSTCFECLDCLEGKKLERLSKFDIKNVKHVRKEIVKKMGIANTNKNGSISLEFIFPIKGDHPLELVAKIKSNEERVDLLMPFRYSNNKVTIFKSQDDPAYYICPESGFSQSRCLICENCVEKMEQIKSFKFFD